MMIPSPLTERIGAGGNVGIHIRFSISAEQFIRQTALQPERKQGLRIPALFGMI